MAKYKKSKEELKEELKEQLESFSASLRQYDEGYSWASKGLANTIAILLYDGGHNKSLLKQLGLKNGLKAFSSYSPLPKSSFAEAGKTLFMDATPLLAKKISNGEVSYVPLLEWSMQKNVEGWMPFMRWWERSVFHPGSDFRLTRKNLIWMMRCEDGGSHVDGATKDESYHRVKTDMEGWRICRNGEQEGMPLKNAHRPLIRQIAWEVEKSLKKNGILNS